MRKRRLCFAGFVMRIEDNRLPNQVRPAWDADDGQKIPGWAGERLGVPHLGENLVAFGMEDEKEGGRWQTSALKQEEWFDKIKDGVARFMRKWHAREAEASAKHQLARAEETPLWRRRRWWWRQRTRPPRGRRAKETGERRRLSARPPWRRRRRERETGRQR